MTVDLTNKIKNEILLMQKRRHEFCLRKLAFATAFLGVGAAGVKFSPSTDMSFLLYLAPLIAIAYDVHILAEDFRIKRGGQFILRGLSTPTKEEIDWERYVRFCRTRIVSLQYCLVTLVIILGAGLVLWKRGADKRFLGGWFIFMVIFEVVITWISWRLRKRAVSLAQRFE